MEPRSDLVCSLIETQFSKWKDEDKKDLLAQQPPRPILSLNEKPAATGGLKSKHKRNFQSTWYTSYPWLCGSTYLNKLFCWHCLVVGIKKGAWNNLGFDNLGSATRSFQKHEGSADHIKNSIGFKELKKNQNRISDALQENARLNLIKFNETVRLNRLVMKSVVDAVLFLSKQGLAFRGHDESNTSLNRGNFKELLKLLIQSCPVETKQHYDKIKNVFTGDSKTIQNELIDCISDYLKDHIENEINDATFFAVQVDDTTDITQTSQCSIILRFVSKTGKVTERFLGFYDVSINRKAEALFNLIDCTLEKFSYNSKLIAQCYDGTNVMSGHLTGLQTKVKEKAPQAVFVHCLAHRLNLVLKQSINSISQCRIFFATLTSIPAFFHSSAKRTKIADSIIDKRIPSGIDVRWSSHGKVLKLVVENWVGMKIIFQTIIDDPTSDDKSILQARGYLKDFNSFDFTLFSIIFHDIFELGRILFEILQKKSLDISYCSKQIEATNNNIFVKRNEERFKQYFELAEQKTEIKLKRNLEVKTKEELFQKYKVLYYEILDTVCLEINTRFQDINKLTFVCLGDSTKFETYTKEFPNIALNSLSQAYPSLHFDTARLKNELSFIYADPQFKNCELEKIITNLNDNDTKDIFKEAYKLFSLILTIPSTSCSVERSFSCLKRVKTYLRNSISQDRLNNLALISIEKELLHSLSESVPLVEDIIDKFASLKERKLDLVYKK